MAQLYLVGTPIGNLKDITFRALETLKSVDTIACEDTRTSLKLLNYFEIKKPLMSCHKYNEREAAEKICSLIEDGKDVALITDAGMPAISDPGAIVVDFCRTRGIAVSVVPGATAFASAIALSGVICGGFTFLGFMPEKRSDKVAFVSSYQNSTIPLVFYCAPHDLNEYGEILREVLGVERRVWIVKELTKLHEEVTVTTTADLHCDEPRGEYVLIVEGGTFDSPLSTLTVLEHLKHYISLGESKKDAVKLVAKERGLTKNEVYQQAIDLDDK